MNKLIVELQERAFSECKRYDDDCGDNLVKTNEVFAKFAELIIKECLTAIDNTDTHHAHTSFDHSLVTTTIIKSHKAVKEHFGM